MESIPGELQNLMQGIKKEAELEKKCCNKATLACVLISCSSVNGYLLWLNPHRNIVVLT